MRNARIYYNEKLVDSFYFDSMVLMDSKTYHFKIENLTVALIPFNYLIKIENENQKSI